MIPANVKTWSEKGIGFLVQAGAGREAGHLDSDYEAAGAQIIADRAEIFAKAEVILQVQSFGANDANSEQDLALIRPGQLIAGMMDPLASPETAQQLAGKGVTAVAMELVPRISRAQDMDVLSSMATLAGYKAVLLAASELPQIMPMLMTAAGTLQPARVLIMGAGVAGLQACATAKRLGAVVEAYDVRAAAREQIISVGAKPIELDLETETAEGSGGYAAEQSEDFLKRQRELMNEVVAPQDVVITTAAVPGAKSPILVTNEMLNSMKPGAVIIDLAAERGGNCELTKVGERVEYNGITILGPENVPSTIPTHASQMYSKNMDVLLSHLLNEDNALVLDFEDDIISGVVAAHDGDVPHPMIRGKLGLPELAKPAEPEQPAAEDDASVEDKSAEDKA
jgi:NAD(P) transhydrogenase subunit alpha